MSMTISEWLASAYRKIDRLDAELILTDFLKVSDRSYLIAHNTDQLPSTDIIDKKVARRANKEPLAYILGWREFYGRKFFVTPDVLIPRPETEDIIELAKSIRPHHILDVGTGSGCVAITLALELPKTTVTALDISDSALRIAQKNASHHNTKIDFHKSDLLKDYQPEPNTLIIANLPYVDANWKWLDHKSLKYEPSLALYAEQGGLELIFRLIDQAPKECPLLLEADTSQHDAIIKYAITHGRKLRAARNFIIYLK